MNASYAGELADGWRVVKLGDAVTEAQLGFACGQRDPKGVIQLRMNNVTNDGQLDWSLFIRVPAEAEAVAAYRLQSGDVLFNNTNSTDLVGKAALFENYDEPVVFSNHFTRMRTNAEKLDPRFLALWLQQQWQRRVFANICDRWIGQSAVQRDKLLSLEIPLPPLPEQRRIAGVLREQMAAVAAARSSAEAQLEAAQALPTAYLRTVFEDSKSKNRWQSAKLGELTDVVRGSSPRPKDDPRYYGGKVPRLMVADVTRDVMYVTPKIDFLTDEGAKLSRPMKKGDVVMVVSGDPGLPGILAVDACIHDGFVGFRNLHEDVVRSEFFFWFLKFVKFETDLQATGAIFRNLTTDQIKRIEINLPPLSEQRRITVELAERLAGVERLRRSLAEQLEAIEKLPAALLRRAFSGESSGTPS